MLDIGWTELLLIGVVALIVIGPKDLPVMFHTLGRITSRARGMAREFTSAMDDAAKASGVHEATKELRDLQKIASPRSLGLDALGRAADKFEKWDPLQPVRDASAAVPDPAAPPPSGVVAPPAGAGTPAGGAGSPAPVKTATAPYADATAAPRAAAAKPGATASGLSLGAAPAAPPPSSAASAPSSAAQPPSSAGPTPASSPVADAPAQPGARRLHAVRRSDRS